MIIFICLIAILAMLYIFNRYSEKLSAKHISIIFAGILLLGFSLRLVAVLKIPCQPYSDYQTMFSAAQSFARGGKPFAMGSYFQRFPHMTTFSVLCGLFMKIFGDDVLVVKIFSVIFKTLAIFAAGLIGKELFGRKGMLSAAFLYAVFPADIFYTPVAATENYAITFLLFSLLFYIKAYKSDNNRDVLKLCFVSGLILSAGCLLRGVAPFYLAAYVAGIVLLFGKISKKLISVFAILIAFVLVFQAVSLTLYYTGVTEYKLSDKGEPYVVYMLVGSNFETNGMYSADDHGVYLDAGEDPEKASKIAKEKLFKRLAENKEKIIPLILKKTDIIWSDGSFNGVYWSMIENGVETDNSFAPTAHKLCKVFYYFLLIMSLLALFFYKKRAVSFLLLLLPLAFEGGLMLMEIQPRYTFSVAYIFVLFGALGICSVYEFINKKFIAK